MKWIGILAVLCWASGSEGSCDWGYGSSDHFTYSSCPSSSFYVEFSPFYNDSILNINTKAPAECKPSLYLQVGSCDAVSLPVVKEQQLRLQVASRELNNSDLINLQLFDDGKQQSLTCLDHSLKTIQLKVQIKFQNDSGCGNLTYNVVGAVAEKNDWKVDWLLETGSFGKIKCTEYCFIYFLLCATFAMVALFCLLVACCQLRRVKAKHVRAVKKVDAETERSIKESEKSAKSQKSYTAKDTSEKSERKKDSKKSDNKDKKSKKPNKKDKKSKKSDKAKPKDSKKNSKKSKRDSKRDSKKAKKDSSQKSKRSSKKSKRSNRSSKNNSQNEKGSVYL